MVAAHADGINAQALEVDAIGQGNGLQHHHQLMEAIGTIANDFQIQIDFGRGD